MHKLLLALICLFGTAELTRVQAAVFIPVPPVPGATSTTVTGINDNNTIVGYFSDSSNIAHGFFGTLDGNYTIFDAGDGSSNTNPLAIDDAGDITGWAGGGLCSVAFERAPNGTIVYVRKRRELMKATAVGLNKKREFVGFYCDFDGVWGFYGKNGKYKAAMTVAGNPFEAFPLAINREETVAGFYISDSGHAVGFLLQGDVLSTVTLPNALETQVTGLNDQNIAAATWSDSNQWHASLFDISANAFTSIEPPGAVSSRVGGINNAGLAAVSSNIGSFIYCPKAKRNCPGNGTEVSIRRSAAKADGYRHR